MSGNGTYNPTAGFTTTTPGDYWWYTIYGGDTNNNTATSSCASMAETVIGPGVATQLVFVGQPQSTYAGSAMTPAVTVQVEDAYGNAVSQSGVSVSLGISSGSLSSGAGPQTTNSSGLATFNGVTVGIAGINLTLNANASGLTQGTSTGFNVTVLVQNGATLTDAATDAGSGVNSVAYYYCLGYTANCTSSSGTFVGASSNSANSFQVTWSGEPGNGPYDVVAVGTDNVGNVSGASTSIPVTLSNNAPTVTVTYPTSTTYHANWSGTITGTASSNDGPGTSISSAQVEIEDTTASPNTYWNGSTWQTTAVFDNASGAASWNYGLSATNLTSGHSYSVTGAATDSIGNTGVSTPVSFTYYAAPTMTTGAASPISTTTATLNGSVNAAGDTDTVKFCYSTTQSQVTTCSGGTVVTASPATASGSSSTPESAALTGLSTNTTYYFNIEATNPGGTTYYGTVQSFTTAVTVTKTAAGTYTLTVPAHVTSFGFTVNGAGGGGGANGSSGYSAGAAGGTVTGTVTIPNSSTATQFTVVVGGGGGLGANGSPGSGGAAGTGGTACAAGGAGGQGYDSAGGGGGGATCIYLVGAPSGTIVEVGGGGGGGGYGNPSGSNGGVGSGGTTSATVCGTSTGTTGANYGSGATPATGGGGGKTITAGSSSPCSLSTNTGGSAGTGGTDGNGSEPNGAAGGTGNSSGGSNGTGGGGNGGIGNNTDTGGFSAGGGGGGGGYASGGGGGAGPNSAGGAGGGGGSAFTGGITNASVTITSDNGGTSGGSVGGGSGVKGTDGSVSFTGVGLTLA